MLSRVADSLFWMSRYMERTDSVLRHIYVHYILSLDLSDREAHDWNPLIRLYSFQLPDADSKQEDLSSILTHLISDEANSNSIRSIVTKARENARGAQDHITKEVWKVVNGFYHQVNHPELPELLQSDNAIKTIESFARNCALYSGTADQTMSRGMSWNFINLGKFIERCHLAIAVIKSQVGMIYSRSSLPEDILDWRYLLLTLSGYELHLKNYHNKEHVQNVIHQVTLNENFPRSIIYALTQIGDYLENIMKLHEEKNSDLERSFGILFSKVRFADLRNFNPERYMEFLTASEIALHEFNLELCKYYFSYS